MFHVATEKETREGLVTDIYFQRTREILLKKGINKNVKAEVYLKKVPYPENWGVLAGVEECLNLLNGIPVKVRMMAEGTVFRKEEPVMVIEGKYLDFGVYETAILGLLCQASGIATKAARCRVLVPDKALISFGARRMHPSVAPMVERSAFIGGFDGVAAVKSAQLLGEPAAGTMPHALIIIMGDTVAAAEAFDEVIDPRVKRVALIDTFNDEKFEAVRVAEALKEKLYAVRLDTPSSRRGNFRTILNEVRWELDARGFKDVKLFVSGGLEEDTLIELRDIVDAFGVGTAITNAKVLDFALDLVEIEGEKIAKRGKCSGEKKVLRCRSCLADWVVLEERVKEKCSCGGQLDNLLKEYLAEGRRLAQLPTPQEIRKFVISQLGNQRLMADPYREAVLEGVKEEGNF